MSIPTRQELKDSIMDENVLFLYTISMSYMKFYNVTFYYFCACSRIQLDIYKDQCKLGIFLVLSFFNIMLLTFN